MPERADIEKLKARAANLRKIAKQSHTQVGKRVAERMAAEAEKAVLKAEAERFLKQQ